jgi:transcription elongation factor GreA
MTNIILTKAAREVLEEQLEHLEQVERPAIIEKVKSAREEGDLKENAGYHAAREDHAKLESQIEDLKSKLKNATIKDSEASDAVDILSVVTADISGRNQKFLLADKELSFSTDLTIYTPASPIGQAIIGLKKGDTAQYTAPSGKEIIVKIIDIEAYNG